MSGSLWFRQLLSGRDFAVGDPAATQMANHVYLLGDRTTGDAVVVDPCYAVGELLDAVEAAGMRLRGVLATHHHSDHVGGSMRGHPLEGVREVLERVDVPVHVQRREVEWLVRSTGLPPATFTPHDGGDVVRVGGVDITLLHTPGHTPGSQCFLVQDRLVSGDTLFLDGCGRTDLPGSDPEEMWHSLQRLAALPDDLTVFPGHRYSLASRGTMAALREGNVVFRLRSRQEWLDAFGPS